MSDSSPKTNIAALAASQLERSERELISQKNTTAKSIQMGIPAAADPADAQSASPLIGRSERVLVCSCFW